MNTIDENTQVLPADLDKNANDSNVMTEFEDSAPTSAAGRPIMPTLTISMEEESIKDFLSRPIKIRNGTNAEGPIDINPMSLFFDNLAVQRKISNYKYMRFTLNIRYSESPQPFVYGRKIMYYRPLNVIPGVTVFPAYKQLQNVEIDPTKANAYQLSLPFFANANYFAIYDLINGAPNNYNLSIDEYVTYRRADTSTTPVVQYSIHAWLSDVVLTVTTPTSITIQSKTVSKSEYNGMVSRPASIVADAAKTLSQVPFLSKFTTPIEAAANMAAKVSSLFGFSKPTCIDPVHPYANNPHFNMTSTTQLDFCQQLTTDPKHGVIVSSEMFDGETSDNLSFHNFLNRMTTLNRYEWQQGDAVDTVVARIPVTPAIVTDTVYAPGFVIPPMGEVATYFKYWRGTMRYTISVVASKFHKGRLRILWSPELLSFPLSEPISNQVQSIIFDVTTDDEITVDINWASNFNYIPVQFVRTSETTVASHHGYLYVMVHQELTAPEATADATVLISGSAPGVSFAVPSALQVQRFHTYARIGAPIMPSDTTLLTPYPPFVNSSDYTSIPVAVQFQSGPLVEKQKLTMTHSFNRHSDEDNTDKINIGESILSFRTLCKSYWHHETGQFPAMESSFSYWTYLSFNLTPSQSGSSSDFPDDYLMYSESPITRLFSNFMRFRGSMRYKIILTSDPHEYYEIKVIRVRGNALRYGGTFNEKLPPVSMLDGQGVAFDMHNHSITFEIPYSTMNQHIGTSRAKAGAVSTPYIDSVIVMIWVPPSTTPLRFNSYISIGEDTNYIAYTGTGQTLVSNSLYDDSPG